MDTQKISASMQANNDKPYLKKAAARAGDRPGERILASPRKTVLKGPPRLAETARNSVAVNVPVSQLMQDGNVANNLSSRQHKAFPFLPADAMSQYDGMHKPIGLIVGSALVLETAVQLTGVGPGIPLLAGIVGASVGALYAGLNRVGMQRLWRTPDEPQNIVITGSSKGIGKALAREFLRAGDRVVVTSRSMSAVRAAIAELREEVTEDVQVYGIDCDVSSEASVARLADFAASQLGSVDVWINNAGYSGSYKSFLELTPQQISQVVSTNLTGSLLCTQAAMRVMASQLQGGHVFNMDGAGADGMPTPMYTAYGATKAGIAHLMKSLVKEAEQLSNPVGVHTLSPGMCLTELLLDNATEQNKQVFNILCEQPETVAAFLVPRVRTVAARGMRTTYIKYLTVARALSFFLTAPVRAGRYFDADGRPIYATERERVMGNASKRAERLANRAARRSSALAYTYSLSLAASYLLFMMASTPSI